MENKPSGQMAREQIERNALRLLCSERIAPETRMQLAEMVSERAFGDELNRVVYGEIVGVGAVTARRLRELLPGRVTLRGFPDFELKEFLGSSGAVEDIDKLFENLLELTEEVRVESKKALGHSA